MLSDNVEDFSASKPIDAILRYTRLGKKKHRGNSRCKISHREFSRPDPVTPVMILSQRLSLSKKYFPSKNLNILNIPSEVVIFPCKNLNVWIPTRTESEKDYILNILRGCKRAAICTISSYFI